MEGEVRAGATEDVAIVRRTLSREDVLWFGPAPDSSGFLEALQYAISKGDK